MHTNYNACLTKSLSMFGMRFASSKCKTFVQNRYDPEPGQTLNNGSVEVVEKFTYLGSIISLAAVWLIKWQSVSEKHRLLPQSCDDCVRDETFVCL